MSRFHNALYAGDVRGRIAVLCEVGLHSLAYVTAKTNALDDVADEFLQATGLNEADIEDVPTFSASTLKPPPVVTCTTNLNWPSVSTEENFFDRALANGKLEGGSDVPYVNGADIAGVAASSALDALVKGEEAQDEIDPEDGGWELDAGDVVSPQVDLDEGGGGVEEDTGAGATPGIRETELWAPNSPFAADHVAAGSFDTAMQLGVVNFTLLKPKFLSIY